MYGKRKQTRKAGAFKRRRACRAGAKRKSAPSFATKVKKVLRTTAERKIYQNPYSTAISSTGDVSSLCDMITGITDETRVGNEITAYGISIKGNVRTHASAASGTWLRLSVVQDTQQVKDTAPGYTDIYESVQIDSGLNLTNRGRFKILWSKKFVVNQNFANQSKLLMFNDYIKLKDVRVTYNGGAIGDINKNGLYFCVLSDQPTNTATPDFNNRLYFMDM